MPSFLEFKDNDGPASGSAGDIQGFRSGMPSPRKPSDRESPATEVLAAESTPPRRDKRKRGPPEDDSDGYVGSDGDFQTDTRHVKNPDVVRAQLWFGASKLPTEATGQAPPSQEPAMHATEPSKGLRQSLASARYPYGNMPDFKNINKRKALNLETNRRPATAHSPPATDDDSSLPSPRRRKWSDEDSATLIELIASKKARWSVIESHYQHRFQCPRNQQAYRDRARNLKVDFLLSDSLLPPGFDLVALGRKEIQKVLRGGRNPRRKEDEVLHGKPVNTLPKMEDLLIAQEL
ncbi:hypothetical protein E4U42_003696 [Claviceps africana]|uniref:Myb-like domain-containing protein n=1 Tax=Claviceps africana TaxID=83212 RepID=A0A8K0NIN4_9HYPO|nr:hypothetical protein E4U42_003696 [Claviceps africana]